jgi:hypothetical protein
MSHSVNIKTQFKQIDTLLEQFKAKGWTILTDTTCKTYYSDPRQHEKHKYVAKNPKPGGYDIGIDIDSDGNAYFVCDFYDRSIEQQLGKNLKDIKQGYAMDELRKFMHAEDLDYRVDTLETGELVVTAGN